MLQNYNFFPTRKAFSGNIFAVGEDNNDHRDNVRSTLAPLVQNSSPLNHKPSPSYLYQIIVRCFATVVFSPRHNQSRLCFCSRLIENVRINSVVFSPRHNQSRLCFCSRLIENVVNGTTIFRSGCCRDSICLWAGCRCRDIR